MTTPPPHLHEGRSQDWADTLSGTGCERPDALAVGEAPRLIPRSVAVVDLCSFTSFCDRRGPADAIAELDRFRNVVRNVSARRGVRVAKWLGDGAMIVGVQPGPAAAAAVEIVARVDAAGVLNARAGVAAGEVLLFDGDDHVGRAANIAARLCDLAGSGEVLASATVAANLPEWIVSERCAALDVRGVDARVPACQLRLSSDVELPTVQ
jgi:class 3 adenylate cyclase